MKSLDFAYIRSSRAFLGLFLATLAFAACDSTDPSDENEPIPLTLALFTSSPTSDELAAVRADWSTRDTDARGVGIEAEGTLMWGNVPMQYMVVSHEVAGIRHVGAILVPESLGPNDHVPVLVYAHGGYTGPGGFNAPVEAIATRLPGEPLRSRLVYVIPSYRGERIQVAGTEYTSGGSVSIGNYDVDDTMALLSVALERVPQADGDRVAVVGESRGALVALEMGARDPRVDLVVDAYGSTDFRMALTQVPEEIFEASIRAAVAMPDATEHILTRSLLPLDQITVGVDSTLTITEAGLREARLALARTAPVNYVPDLPVTQVHHGTDDTVAHIEYSRALRDAFAATGRPSGSETFTYYEYDGGQHDVLTLSGYFARVADELMRVLNL